MTGPWTLPTQAALSGGAYAIRTDYRDILELLRWLGGQADPALDQAERWYVAMGLFYPEFDAMTQNVWPEATRFLAEFLAAGRREEPRPGPALMDWQQDAALIAAGTARAAGAVIPPNRKFLALLGDQGAGTNVEAPLATIRQAMAEVLAGWNGANDGQPINVYIGEELLDSVIANSERRRSLRSGGR